MLFRLILLITLILPIVYRARSGPIDAEQVVDEPVLTNTKCPVLTNEPVDRDIFVEYEGQRVYFCCNRCRRMFLETPEKYLAQLPQFANRTTAENASTADEASPPDSASAPGGAQDVASGERTGSHIEHDHAGHVEPGAGALRRLIAFFGKFHPVVVHFPIALLIVALVGELAGLFSGREWLHNGARFCMWAGAAGALIAAPLGWAAASVAGYPGLESYLTAHRWLGSATAVWALLLLILDVASRNSRSAARRRVFVAALLIGAILVGVTGHLGGTLVFGPDYYRF
ncbi:MAG: hypothetical protein Kow0059_10140 [Candidatus Sumerlaeia bacterium]